MYTPVVGQAYIEPNIFVQGKRLGVVDIFVYTPDTAVLQIAGSCSIEKRIILNQMRWAWHLVREEDIRLPTQLFYGELIRGKRPQYKPRKRFKHGLKALDIDEWEVITEWRKLVMEDCIEFEQKRVDHAVLTHAFRKQESANVVQELKCNICGRILLSKAGYANHLKSPRYTRMLKRWQQ